MFAKFSPDGRRVAFVRDHNLYVEDLADGAILAAHHRWLADQDQRHVRLGVRGGILAPRRLPLEPRRRLDRLLADGHVGDEGLLPDQDDRDLYPKLTPIRYPKVGETNPACRVGVVPSRGARSAGWTCRATRATIYIPRMDWAATRRSWSSSNSIGCRTPTT